MWFRKVEEIFEIIDVDGSDDVTEAELIFGIEVMLELQKCSELDLEELRRRLSRRAPAEEPSESLGGSVLGAGE